jgi:hypothetical protein
MVSGLLALLSLTGGVVGPTGPDKAAQRYRLDLVIVQEVDATAAGQGVAKSDITSSAFVTVTMSDTTGGKLAHVVIDSVNMTVNGPLAQQYTQELAVALRNQFLHGYIVDGKMVGAAKPSVEDNNVMTLVMPVMNTMFPGVGAKSSGVQSWTDTTKSDVTNEQMTQHNQAVIVWTVTGREGELVSLTGAGTGTINIEGEAQQATGTVTTSVTVTTVMGGPAKSSKLVSSQQINVMIPQLPDAIPVKVDTDATLTQIP